MRSTPFGKIGGNAKLRGKRSATLACGCCDLFNFKRSERWKEAAKEIKLFIKHGK